MSKNWQQFLFCVLAQLCLPLLPLLIEFLLTGAVSAETWALSAAMYTIAIGVSSKILPTLGLSIFVSMLFVCSFGFIKSGNTPQFDVGRTAGIVIFLFLIIHGIERYFRHVKGDETFIDLNNDGV